MLIVHSDGVGVSLFRVQKVFLVCNYVMSCVAHTRVSHSPCDSSVSPGFCACVSSEIKLGNLRSTTRSEASQSESSYRPYV
jgi:hypothetical protein